MLSFRVIDEFHVPINRFGGVLLEILDVRILSNFSQEFGIKYDICEKVKPILLRDIQWEGVPS